jgi:hypothetical protein
MIVFVVPTAEEYEKGIRNQLKGQLEMNQLGM